MRFLTTTEQDSQIDESILDTEDFNDMSTEDTLKILVPSKKIGLIIGKSGRNIRRLKQKHFNIKIIDRVLPNSQEKILVLSRMHKDQGDLVKLLKELNKIIGKPIGYALYDPNNPTNAEAEESTPQSMILSLEKRLVGAVIGKEGSMIKSLREDYSVKLHVKPARKERRDIIIYGTLAAMDQVKRRIEEICDEETRRLDELLDEQGEQEDVDQVQDEHIHEEERQRVEVEVDIEIRKSVGESTMEEFSDLRKKLKKISFEE